MSTAPSADVPALLRFLTQTAKLPLSTAMSKIPVLIKANLTTSVAIAAAPLKQVEDLLFPDDIKQARQLHNAAKRETKKRKAGEDVDGQLRKKKAKADTTADPATALEESLALPSLASHFPDLDSTDTAAVEDLLSATTLTTNRAPLLLAFALVLLQFTMPAQPLSSRLSLAQAVVSEGARKRARELGIDPQGGKAEEEGWGDGQPAVTVMGRKVRVLRRAVVAAEPDDEALNTEAPKVESEEAGKSDAGAEEREQEREQEQAPEREPALWALDLEALKKANTSPLPSASSPASSINGLPIYSPNSARSYLLKSFACAPFTTTNNTSASSPLSDPTNAPSTTSPTSSTPPKSTKAAKARKPPSEAKQKEANLAFLLHALTLLFASWGDTLTREELDRRAWGWYVAVRPAVEDGRAGWGERGTVRLGRVLELRRVVDGMNEAKREDGGEVEGKG